MYVCNSPISQNTPTEELKKMLLWWWELVGHHITFMLQKGRGEIAILHCSRMYKKTPQGEKIPFYKVATIPGSRRAESSFILNGGKDSRKCRNEEFSTVLLPSVTDIAAADDIADDVSACYRASHRHCACAAFFLSLFLFHSLSGSSKRRQRAKAYLLVVI